MFASPSAGAFTPPPCPLGFCCGPSASSTALRSLQRPKNITRVLIRRRINDSKINTGTSAALPPKSIKTPESDRGG